MRIILMTQSLMTHWRYPLGPPRGRKRRLEGAPPGRAQIQPELRNRHAWARRARREAHVDRGRANSRLSCESGINAVDKLSNVRHRREEMRLWAGLFSFSGSQSPAFRF